MCTQCVRSECVHSVRARSECARSECVCSECAHSDYVCTVCVVSVRVSLNLAEQFPVLVVQIPS